MRWLLAPRLDVRCATIAVSAFALFPLYWVVITSLKPRQRDLHAHAGPVAQRPAVAPVPATCSARAQSAARC